MSFIYGEVLKPLGRRLGTGFGAYLMSLGVAEGTATTIAAGAAALIGVGVDLALSHYNRTA